ncbi:MAG: bifunctional diaminohydroxyphosphoribosylaminopyrimidine deaminase/5-amino-6-(5-phosphoribosylamino)uracil reductase RibD [Proteobacteria bacterium]|nr:bifunctional diaminohydroxyphosphoribosylaminopyrimidine deaminase/5-amino-6-(5-phosphoribosylamino)uracil reductase RibD [Pseudomonadota bacterium]MBU2227911.1 bifunctional diaminohydroxyphosphoribosylaminopyrimidine deaminase/5-amino-6-(5-phosphoribosylamino)uracil reductase RibD [Pseudomonadota bacterium]MBU2261356.1 bifunctional diaminohydroxyphosphoribosylaminopyrimidine deaminase/5-amino-6-(5-phosphoribosylamino)uracil reductase RibD [Pseudomonadota bacterium]
MIGLTDEYYMRRALRLARKRAGKTSPNPLVGAVIVREGTIIGEGCHHRCGENHAEINAIESATETVAGATFYITLEPCSHHGRTPPCVDAVIACRPDRVVVGTTDPNPLVSGKGIEILRQSGIETRVGVLEEACREINEVFFKYILTGLPYVTLKFAQTLDGRIATASGDSRWISSNPSRKYAHRLRSLHDAILVGADTVLKDDPELTCRLVRGKNPLRIVCDSRLRLPLSARVFSDGGKTLLVATRRAAAERRRAFAERGIEVLEIAEDRAGRVDLREILRALGKREISSLLVEGGAAVITAFLKENLADRLLVVLSPKIVGAGVNSVGELGVRRMDDALGLSLRRIIRRGDDLILDARFNPPASR